MFKELVPILRDRAVLLTVTHVDEDQIRVNIVPKKLKDGDNDALTTPLSVTGTAEDLDAELSTTIISFVGSHLQMKNTLEKAKAEMDAASKVAQAEARAKSKTGIKSAPSKPDSAQPAAAAKPSEPTKPALQKPASLFDAPAPAVTTAVAPAESEEDPGFAEVDDDEPIEENEVLDDAA
ncbi:MAG: PRTRC system protein E [Terracidiphilus sp.]|jgi:PRTRC genetic system protein E